MKLGGLPMLLTRLAVVALLAVLIPAAPIATAQTESAQTSDTALVAAVKRALSGQSDLRKLAVSAAGSEVTLKGRVPTLWLKLDAVKRTLKVTGVKTVVTT